MTGEPRRWEKGTKFALTVAFLVISSAMMIASYALALADKLSREWVDLVQIWLPTLMLAVGGYQAARTITDTKAIGAGLAATEQPKEETE